MTRLIETEDKARRSAMHSRRRRFKGGRTAVVVPENCRSQDDPAAARPGFASLFDEQERTNSPMRVLLQNAKTMKYVGQGERWTKDSKQARDFHTGWSATVQAFANDPHDLLIHYEFDDDRYDLHIPVLSHRDA